MIELWTNPTAPTRFSAGLIRQNTRLCAETLLAGGADFMPWMVFTAPIMASERRTELGRKAVCPSWSFCSWLYGSRWRNLNGTKLSLRKSAWTLAPSACVDAWTPMSQDLGVVL